MSGKGKKKTSSTDPRNGFVRPHIGKQFRAGVRREFFKVSVWAETIALAKGRRRPADPGVRGRVHRPRLKRIRPLPHAAGPPPFNPPPPPPAASDPPPHK